MWPPEAIEFLAELETNNEREWFKQNRKRYDEFLLAPARALAESVAELGEPRFFRPFRDTRFRPGPPIKEQLGVGIGNGEVGGYYFELSLDGLLVGGGLHHPAADQLERFRRAMDDDRRAQPFEDALSVAGDAGLTPIEPELKRAPKGYSPDHPRIERLRMKRLTIFRRHDLGHWLHTAECDERVRSELFAARPLVEWLQSAVGPSTQPRER